MDQPFDLLIPVIPVLGCFQFSFVPRSVSKIKVKNRCLCCVRSKKIIQNNLFWGKFRILSDSSKKFRKQSCSISTSSQEMDRITMLEERLHSRDNTMLFSIMHQGYLDFARIKKKV